jgi:glycosyltransferase involved in cell wall biosynthesis
MRIVYIIPTLKRAGPIIVLYNIIKYLDRERFDPVIITLFPEPHDSMISDFRDLEVSIDILGLSKIGWIYTGFRVLRNHLLQLNADIIHSHAFQPDVLLSRCKTGAPRVSTLHCDMYEFYPLDYGFWGHFVAWTHVFCLNRLDVIATCSETLREKFAPQLKTRVLALQNGVDDQRFRSVPSDKKRQFREKLHLPQDKRIYISTGLLSARKDPLASIEAFLQFNKDKRCAFVLLGDGPLAKKCREASSNDPDIILRGKVDNVLDYLCAVDFFISASHVEGLPMAVMEALALGLPCILSDIPSHREMFRTNSTPAFFFQAGDPSGLIQCLRDTEASDYDALSMQAKDIISSHFNAKRTAKEYQDLYSQLLETKRVAT